MESHLTMPTKTDEKDRNLHTNYLLFVIPSWHKVLDTPLGKYANQNVTKIHDDPVIFFSSKECAVETPQGTAYYLFGIGYYYQKFQLSGEKYITDNRPLTGLILTDFVYDKIASSRPLALEDELDVNVCEHAIKVPVDLSFKPEQKVKFIRGVLIRYLFTKNKEILLEMLDKIQNPDSYILDQWGHLLLSTLWNHYNQILVSKKMSLGVNSAYMNITAGLDAIIPGADDLLAQTFSDANLLEISYSIQILKSALLGVKFDSIDFYSVLDNLALTLRTASLIPPIPTEKIGTGLKFKRNLFLSAANRIDSKVEWPPQFKGTALEAERSASASETAEPEFKTLVHQFYKKMEAAKDADPSLATAVKIEGSERENYQLRKLQRTSTEKKLLPAAPEGNLEELFLYLKYILEENFDMPTVGKAFELARENLRKIQLQSKYIRLMSRWANLFLLKPEGISLNVKEKEDVLREVNGWIAEVEFEKRKEQERIERERLEKERKEQERLEKERLERERQEAERLARLEQERLERERQEAERLARLEQERRERERQEAERLARLEQERLKRERQEVERLARLEQERRERERQDKERKEREIREKVQIEKERLLREKEELKKLVQERKQKEKEEKARQKQLKKIEKQKQNVEKQKEKERKKLEKLK